MASGSFSNCSGQNCKLVINWSSSKGNSGSTVNATLVAQNQNNWYFNAYVYGGYGITINGDEVTGSDKALSGSMNGSVNLISHSVWVAYTGDKTINIQGYANFNGIPNLSNQTISGNVQLDNVGYVPTMGSVTSPTTSIVSETTTSITVKWNKASSYDGACIYSVGCSINGGAYEWKYPESDINTTSYTWQIGTPIQGATYEFAVSAKNNIGWSSYEYSGKVTINKINPPTIGDIGTYNPYTNSTLDISLTGGSSTNGEKLVRLCDLYYGDTWLCGSKGYDATSWNNTSQTIIYAADSYTSNLGSKAYSSNNFRIVAWCENAHRSRSSYVSKNFTVNINSDGGATPTIGAPTISGGELGYPSTCFVAGISTINVVSPNATLRRAPSGTTLSYQISCIGTNSQNTQNASFYNLSQGHKTITVTATDSRGLSVSVSKTIVVQPYAAPTIRNYLVTRLDNPQTSAKLIYELGYSKIYSYSDGTNKGDQLNTINTQQYSKDNSTWVNASNGLVITDLSTESIYTIYLRVADKLRPTTYTFDTQKVPTIRTNVAIRKHGIGINCVPQTSYALEVNGSSKISGSLDASNMLQVNSNGVAIGKASEKSAFEVNMDSYLYKNLGVTGDIYQSASSCSKGDLGSVPIAGTAADMTLGDIRKYKSGLYTSVVDGDWKYLWVNKHRNGASDGNGYNNYIMQSFWNDDMYHGRVDGAGGIESKHLFLDTGNFLNKLYPVGAIYLTWNNNNPSNFLGGTWVQFGQGRTLIGQGTGNDGSTSMSFSANSSGGKYKTSHSHTTSFGWDDNAFFAGKPDGAANNNYSRTSVVANGYVIHTSSSPTSASRLNWTEDIAINHIQPYVTIYFWRRTA